MYKTMERIKGEIILRDRAGQIVSSIIYRDKKQIDTWTRIWKKRYPQITDENIEVIKYPVETKKEKFKINGAIQLGGSSGKQKQPRPHLDHILRSIELKRR